MIPRPHPETVIEVLGEVSNGGQRGPVPGVVRVACVIGSQALADAPGDPGSGVLDRIPGKVRVSGVGMAERFPNHGPVGKVLVL